MPACTWTVPHVVRLDHHVGGHALGGKASLEPCCRSGSPGGPGAGRRPVTTILRLSAGIASATSAPPAIAIESHGRRITRSTTGAQKRGLPGAPTPRQERMLPLSIRSPSQARSAGSTRQRGEHRDRHHQDRSLREREERLVAAQEHARPWRRSRSGRRSAPRAPRWRRPPRAPRAAVGPGRAPRARADVEERVVDADREPDQEDHRLDSCCRSASWLGSAIRPAPPSRTRPRGAGNERGHQRAEGDDQDEQGQGQREQLRLAEVAGERVLDLLVRADVAELLDQQLGVLRAHGRNRALGGFQPIACLEVVAR